MTLTALTKENFAEEVLKYKGLVLVEFKQEWYGSSEIIALILEKLEPVYKDRIKFYCLDCETYDPVAEQFYIQELPTILLFRDGLVVDRIVGMISTKGLKERIDLLLEAD